MDSSPDWISCVAGLVVLLDLSEQHTPGQRSSYLSAQRSTFRPPRSPVLTSPPGLGPPVLPTNHSSTHTSAASGVRQDGHVFRDHSALAQLCSFGPPKLSKFCTQCVSESARDSELLFNVNAHLGNPGAREIVQLLVVTSVSSGNPGAMEPTLSSSLLFNMIIHLGYPGAREIVKSLQKPGCHIFWRPTTFQTTNTTTTTSSTLGHTPGRH